MQSTWQGSTGPCYAGTVAHGPEKPALDDVDGAIDWLERSYQQRHPVLRFLGGPGFARLAGEPRYRELRRRIGLPP
jgi:hypothetical protein